MRKVSIYVDDKVWQDFRIACLKRNTSASKEITRLMREQLQRWRQEQEKQP